MSQVRGSAGRALRRSPGLLWIVALAGIGLWMVHITAVSSLVDYTCTEKGTLWWLHAATVVTALPTVLVIWLSWRLVRQSGDPESEGTLAGNYTFVGVFGLIINGFSLALILLEGSYVFFLNPCV
jgi:hypothetical protein